MTDLDLRLRRTFSRMAASESLADVLDEQTASEMLTWGEGIAGQFVLKTRAMDDMVANEYLAPYSSALLKMMRAMGRWVIETDMETRSDWWNLIEQNGKTLYGDQFILPRMEKVLTGFPANAGVSQKLGFIRNLIENQRARA
jgi:hypothetical protein